MGLRPAHTEGRTAALGLQRGGRLEKRMASSQSTGKIWEVGPISSTGEEDGCTDTHRNR